jgi:hypothetical protein
MDIYLVIQAIFYLLGVAWLYLVVVAIYCLYLETDLSVLQKLFQCFISLLLPFIGALLVLHFLYQQSPEIVSRFRLLWPFSSIIRNKQELGGGTGHNGETVLGEWSKGLHGGTSDSTNGDND